MKLVIFALLATIFGDNRFFGSLFSLDIGDEIYITDVFGNKLKYIIFDIYETTPNDISCISQQTNNTRQITLITCNNFNGNRLIIKAKN